METLKLSNEEGVLQVLLDHGKVNAIDTQMLLDLNQVFANADADNAVKGLILTGRDHCFSAGLDVAHLATIGVEGCKEFWRQYLMLCQHMVRFSKPFVCAITGYAPAGATILALTADYRVMGRGDKNKIGMHEFKMSMQIPELLCDIYAYHAGKRQAWENIQQARLMGSDEALEEGLINESVEVEEVLEKAKKHMAKVLRVHAPVYIRTKGYLRKELLDIVDRDMEAMVNVIAADWGDPFVQAGLKAFAASLKK